MVSFHAGAVGLDQAIAAFRGLESDLADWVPFLTLVYEPDLDAMMAQRFESEGSPDRWAPLSPDYAARKAVQYPGKKILEATGALKDAATKKGAANQVRRLSPRSLERGVNLPYGRAHQEGLEPMPARPWSGARPEDEARWGDKLERYAYARALRRLEMVR